jgi:hypothetical protein
MFREGETALCLSEEGELWDGSDQILCFVREKCPVSERGRGAMGW